MKLSPITPTDLRGVVAVPPLCRRSDPARTLDFEETYRLLRHVASGGISRFMFGGNALLYHLPLREYAALLDWLASLTEPWWLLPAAGPGFGRALDQTEHLRKHRFPAAMMLPCSDPRDAAGMETGLREIATAAETPLILYLKDEAHFGPDRQAGLEAVARLVADGVCVGIKYAIVRTDPAEDGYLQGLLGCVPRERVMSGIGERPAVVHLRDWGLPGFTTGSGCIAPALSQSLFNAGATNDWAEAERLRTRFLPLEDCRDAWNPAKVLHHAVELAEVARTGPLLPYLSPLSADQLAQVRHAIQPLKPAVSSAV